MLATECRISTVLTNSPGLQLSLCVVSYAVHCIFHTFTMDHFTCNVCTFTHSRPLLCHCVRSRPAYSTGNDVVKTFNKCSTCFRAFSVVYGQWLYSLLFPFRTITTLTSPCRRPRNGSTLSPCHRPHPPPEGSGRRWGGGGGGLCFTPDAVSLFLLSLSFSHSGPLFPHLGIPKPFSLHGRCTPRYMHSVYGYRPLMPFLSLSQQCFSPSLKILVSSNGLTSSPVPSPTRRFRQVAPPPPPPRGSLGFQLEELHSLHSLVKKKGTASQLFSEEMYSQSQSCIVICRKMIKNNFVKYFVPLWWQCKAIDLFILCYNRWSVLPRCCGCSPFACVLPVQPAESEPDQLYPAQFSGASQEEMWVPPQKPPVPVRMQSFAEVLENCHGDDEGNVAWECKVTPQLWNFQFQYPVNPF